MSMFFPLPSLAFKVSAWVTATKSLDRDINTVEEDANSDEEEEEEDSGLHVARWTFADFYDFLGKSMEKYGNAMVNMGKVWKSMVSISIVSYDAPIQWTPIASIGENWDHFGGTEDLMIISPWFNFNMNQSNEAWNHFSKVVGHIW